MMRASLLAVLALVACDYPAKVAPHGARDATSPDGDGDAPPLLTWHRDVRPLFAARCVRCHRQDAVAPMPLGAYDEVLAKRDAIAVKLASDAMPPWPVDDSCRPLTFSRDLTHDEVATIESWASLDFPEGDPADYVAPAAPPAFVPQSANPVTLSGVAYQPAAASGGDARCFLLTPDAAPGASGWWVTDVRIDPDAERIIQQATLYLVADRDAALPAADYACPAGAGNDAARAVAAWVPGALPTSFPQETALFVPAGARFILRVRYLTSFLDGPVPSDRSGATLWRYEGERVPTRGEVRVHTLRAGGSASVAAQLPHSGTIFATIAEMGPRGRQLLAEYGAGAFPDCLARVQTWGEWQETLYYAEPLATRLGEGATKLLCIHDAASSEPTCRVHLLETIPLHHSLHAPDSPCNGVDTCLAACTGPYCLLDCIAWKEAACGECASSQLLGECLTTLDAASRAPIDLCLGQCPAEAGMAAWTSCALEACAAQLPIIAQTLRDQVESGRCNRPDQSCVFHPEAISP